MNGKKTKGLTLVELVCAVSVLAIISDGLATAFVANQSMSIRAHRITAPVLRHSFRWRG